MKAEYFRCLCCGECCSGEMHVFLNPEDLYLMAEKSGCKNTRELFENGTVIIDRERNRAPLPRIRFREAAVKFCPFLENRIEDDGSLFGFCSLHSYFKPLVCGIAPLYREIDFENDLETWGFKKPFGRCPGCDIEESAEDRYSEITDPVILRRLNNEKKFFRKISEMLDAGSADQLIIEKLYYREVNCTY